MILVVAGTWLTMCLLAYDPHVNSWMRRARWNLSRDTNTVFSLTDHYIDFEDRLLHEELPNADYSRGGVYVFGPSALMWAFTTWDLPSAYQKLIHNYGIGGTGFKHYLAFLRFLVEKRGLIAAGKEKTLVVFGTCYYGAGRTDQFFNSLWGRHSFYSIDSFQTIDSTRLSEPLRHLMLVPIKTSGIVKEMLEIIRLWALEFRQKRGWARSLHNKERWRGVSKAHVGPDWRQKFDEETSNAARTFDYLRERGIPHVVVLTPQASWEDSLPFKTKYIESMRKLCESKAVRLYDLTDILEDNDFADHVHLTPEGMEKFRRAILPICLSHLQSTGALPDNQEDSLPAKPVEVH